MLRTPCNGAGKSIVREARQVRKQNRIPILCPVRPTRSRRRPLSKLNWNTRNSTGRVFKTSFETVAALHYDRREWNSLARHRADFEI
jgi:hypothetical protein